MTLAVVVYASLNIFSEARDAPMTIERVGKIFIAVAKDDGYGFERI